MKQGGFVEAVTYAIDRGSDCWESAYYHGNDYSWNPKKCTVYMETRFSALGPEYKSFHKVKARLDTRRYWNNVDLARRELFFLERPALALKDGWQ